MTEREIYDELGGMMTRSWKVFMGDIPFPQSRSVGVLCFFFAAYLEPKIEVLLTGVKGSSLANLRDLITSCHWSGLWVSWGRPTLVPTKELLASAILTDASAVPSEEIQYPFPAFLVKIPEGLLTISGSANPDRRLPCSSIETGMFRFGRQEQDEEGFAKTIEAVKIVAARLIELHMVGLYDEEAKEISRDFMRTIYEKEVCRGLYFSMSTDSDHLHADSANLYRWSPELGAGSVEDLFGWEENEKSTGVLPFAGEDEKVMRAGGNMLANLALYILHGVAEMKEKKTLQTKRRKKRKERFFNLTSKVRLPDHMIKAAYDLAHGDVVHPHFKVAKRFTVRGHWKHQPYGPGRKERKRIYIDPYWKGPTTGDELHRIYEVD